MQPQSQAPPSGNLLVFFLLAFLLLVGFSQIRNYVSPPPPEPKKDDTPADVAKAKDKQKFVLPSLPGRTPDKQMHVLGDETFTVRAVLDPRGAGVRRVTLNRF